jgi:DNA-binding FadR family transcriptional regulator
VAVQQHQGVLDAVLTRDPDTARRAMEGHLDDSRQFYQGSTSAP